MSEKIEPALTAEEWQYWLGDRGYLDLTLDAGMDAMAYSLHQSRAAIIALANAALPDSDPRKITRALVAMLRDAADLHIGNHNDRCGSECKGECFESAREAVRMADALSSYLPPEEK